MGRDDGRPRLPTRHCCRTCGMPTLMHCTRASSASQTLPVPSHAPISLLVSTMTTRLCSSSVGGGAKGKRHGKRCGGGGGSSEHSRRAERARPATRPASTAGRRAATPTRTRQHACHLANHRCLAHARPAQEQHRVGDCRGGGGPAWEVGRVGWDEGASWKVGLRPPLPLSTLRVDAGLPPAGARQTFVVLSPTVQYVANHVDVAGHRPPNATRQPHDGTLAVADGCAWKEEGQAGRGSG